MPTYIDFASGDLRPPFPPTRPSPISSICQWLGGPHDKYPLATTLDEYLRLRKTGSAPSALEYAALIQCQLTFGLLEAVLRIKIPETFLIVQAADGTTTLSTAKLTTLCRDWYHRIRKRHHPSKCQSWLKDARKTLSTASKWLLAYQRGQRVNPFLAVGLHEEASEAIIRASCTIGYSLQVALSRLPSECDPDRTSLDMRFAQIPDIKPAQDDLRAQGWCPLTITIFETYGFPVLEYARSFKPLMRHTEEHSKCTEAACTINSIDRSTYIQRHSSNECDCSPTIPPFHLIESLLSDGRIPVVTVSDEGRVVLAAEGMPYIAISHVWIDGLGSTTEEGLPACQVARIASMASSLVTGGAFWIDALCVPGQTDLRTRAIQLMVETYSAATAVLVIDAGIRSCSQHAPLEEKLLRIYSSVWMQRLWTYQEGMLAKRLCFEFADGLVDLKALMPSHEEMTSTPLLLHLASILWNMRSYMSKGGLSNDSLTLHSVSQAIRWRTTSRPEDETLAIAGLLQIDVRELLDVSSPNERMKLLLLRKERLPPRIIFHTSPKISGIPGFSWAPRSFMTGPHHYTWVREPPAICTPTGLLAEYASLIFSQPVELDGEMNYVICDMTRPARRFYLHRLSPADQAREFCNLILIPHGIQDVVGSCWPCVGAQMIDVKGRKFGKKVEPEVCHYREIRFALEVIGGAQLRASGTPVIYAKWCPSIKVKVV